MKKALKSEFRPYIVRKAIGDARFSYLVGDEVAQLWYDTPRGGEIAREEAKAQPFVPARTGAIDYAEFRILRDRIALPGSTLIECGSHQGLLTVALAGWVGPRGFVHAFDAVLKNAAIVEKNLSLNGIENACVYCAAISGEFGVAKMRNESNVIVEKTKKDVARGTIMVRLSELFKTPPDALKLDIEGHELGVIENDVRWIARIPRLAIEVHTDMLGWGGVKRMVAALGRRPLYILHEGDKDCRPYQGEKITERCHLFSW
jgi:FkbM family methyltransferase